MHLSHKKCTFSFHCMRKGFCLCGFKMALFVINLSTILINKTGKAQNLVKDPNLLIRM